MSLVLFCTNLDLIVENGKISVLEVKATAKPNDVDIFALEVQVIATQNPDKQVEGIFGFSQSSLHQFLKNQFTINSPVFVVCCGDGNGRSQDGRFAF